MPPDFSALDAAALAWMLVAWVGYSFVVDRLPILRRSLNHHMDHLRCQWMARMLQRENRIMDTQLVGQATASVTFLASTSIIIIAALAGVLGGVDDAHRIVGDISLAQPGSRALFEAKMLVLIALMIFAFLSFTWSIRQYNYLFALVGSAPLAPVPPEIAAKEAAVLGRVLSLAVQSSNAGMRTFYFAVGTLAWFVGPLPFMAATAVMLGVLLRRQLFSRTFAAIREHRDVLG